MSIEVDLNDPVSVGAALQAMGKKIAELDDDIGTLAMLLGLALGASENPAAGSPSLTAAVLATVATMQREGMGSRAMEVLKAGIDASAKPGPFDGGSRLRLVSNR